MKILQNKYVLSALLIGCVAGLYFGRGYFFSGSAIVGFFILFRLSNRIAGERNHDAIFKRALENYEEVINGRLWTTKGAEIIASDRCDHPRDTGPVKYEHICRTSNGSWFIFRVEAIHGRIVLRTLKPCDQTEVKWHLESHPDAYARIFGQPTAA